MIECDKYTVIVRDEVLIQRVDCSKMFMKVVVVDNIDCGLISLNKETFSQPTFSSLRELEDDYNSYNLMLIHSNNIIRRYVSLKESPAIGIQLERNIQEFSSFDQLLLRIFCVAASLKLAIIWFTLKANYFMHNTLNMPQDIILIMNSTNIAELIKATLIVTKRLSFEHSELIFYNPKSSIYSNELGKTLCKNVLNEENGTVEAREHYPSDFGIAGRCFTEKKLIFGIQGKLKQTFQPIDYIYTTQSIKNFLYLPLYEHNEVIGVLQLINKQSNNLDYGEIDKLYEYQKVIGLAIKRIEGLKTTLAASESIKKMVKHITNIANLKVEVLVFL